MSTFLNTLQDRGFLPADIPTSMQEVTLVIPNPLAGPEVFPQGVTTLPEAELLQQDGYAGTWGWLPRWYVNQYQTGRQVIGYTVVEHNLDPLGELHADSLVLVYKRTDKTSEDRLHNRYSFGFGGHPTLDEDHHQNFKQIKDTLNYAVARELWEEVRLVGGWVPQYTGLIIADNQTPVGQAHLGLVYRAAGNGRANQNPPSPEPSQVIVGWYTIRDIQAGRIQDGTAVIPFNAFEPWSRMLADHLVGDAV